MGLRSQHALCSTDAAFGKPLGSPRAIGNNVCELNVNPKPARLREVKLKLNICIGTLFYLLLAPSAFAHVEPLPWFADLQIVDKAVDEDIDSERQQLTMLFEHLAPYYKVTLDSQPLDRGLKLLESLPFSCVSNLIRTPERQKMGYFSEPFSVSIGHHVIYAKHNPKLTGITANRTTAADLPTIVAQAPAMSLGISQGRSYGHFIDKTLAQPEIKERVYWRSGEEKTAGIMEMFLHNRIDLLIEYPVVVSQYLRDNGYEGELSMRPIANATPYIIGRIACSKTPQGRKAIAAIDAALLHLASDPSYFDVLSRPFRANSMELFTTAYYEVFGVNHGLAH